MTASNKDYFATLSCGGILDLFELVPSYLSNRFNNFSDERSIRRLRFLIAATRPFLGFAKRSLIQRVTNGLIPSPMPAPILVPAAFRTAELKMMTNPMQAAGMTCEGSKGFSRRGLRSSRCTLSTGHLLHNSSRNWGRDRRSSDNTTGTSSIGMKMCSGFLAVTTRTTGDIFTLFRNKKRS